MKTLIVNHHANALRGIGAGFRSSPMLWTGGSNQVYDLGAGVVSSALCSINSLFRYSREHLVRVFSESALMACVQVAKPVAFLMRR